MKIHFNYFSF